jgi:hypothetical protein
MAMTDQVRDFDYTGLHAFVFIDAVDPGRNVADVIEDIGGTDGREFPNGRVLFASVTVGAHKGFAHVRADEGDLGALQRLIFEDLWAEGVRCEHAVEGPSTCRRVPRRRHPRAPSAGARRSAPWCGSGPTTTRSR